MHMGVNSLRSISVNKNPSARQVSALPSETHCATTTMSRTRNRSVNDKCLLKCAEFQEQWCAQQNGQNGSRRPSTVRLCMRDS